jgi:hypothetical protein
MCQTGLFTNKAIHFVSHRQARLGFVEHLLEFLPNKIFFTPHCSNWRALHNKAMSTPRLVDPLSDVSHDFEVVQPGGLQSFQPV